MKIYISGYSDDIVDIESDNPELVDEFGAYEKPGWIKIFRADNEGLMVFAQYTPEGTPDGTWVIGVTLLLSLIHICIERTACKGPGSEDNWIRKVGCRFYNREMCIRDRYLH